MDRTPFYLTFTEGWGDEDVVKCTPIAERTQSQRLILCRVNPSIFVQGKYLHQHHDKHFDRVVLFDRFSTGEWLPPSNRTNVGILVGDEDGLKTLDPTKLQLIDWGSVFPSREDAEQARIALRGRS